MGSRAKRGPKSIGAWLVGLRKKKGLTQEAAAQLIGVAYGTWRNWEKDRTTPSRMARERLEERFGAVFPRELL